MHSEKLVESCLDACFALEDKPTIPTRKGDHTEWVISLLLPLYLFYKNLHYLVCIQYEVFT